ncbi:cell division protein PerM [Nocardia alni]|uniref:cell division protein PerM n=1 Tax=Nocardia alni TaxID=2815723 RepID=UPI001C22C62D|nr:DUF6350 family protein [Nocardia alni]
MKASSVRRDPRSAHSGDDDGRRPRPGSRRSGPGPEDNLFLSLTPERARVLLIVAARATSFTVVVIVLLVVATLLAANSTMTGASGAIAAGWLAVHQVPLVIGKTTLSLLPLVPTGLVLWLTARDCARAVEPDSTRADLGWIVGAALSGPLLVTAVCLAVADDASSVVALQPPQALAAFAWVGVLHLLAAVAGIASRRNPLRERLVARLPPWVAPAVAAARRAVRRLLLSGLALALVSLLVHWSRLGDTYRAAGNLGGFLGLTLLSLAYLPNVAIGATSVLVGAEVHIGAGGLSAFAVAGAPVPALPVLAAVPTGPAAGWWPAVLLVPATVGVLAGMDCARGSDDEVRRPWATLTAAGSVMLALALLGVLCRGEVGSFGGIGPNVFVFAGLGLIWTAVPGYVGLLCGRLLLQAPPADFADDRQYVFEDDGSEHDEYYDEDDRGEYESAEYEGDQDEYDDSEYEHDRYHYDDSDGYDRYLSHSDPVVDGELVEEQPALDSRGIRGSGGDYDGRDYEDIVDAEVVESDLPETGRVDGR